MSQALSDPGPGLGLGLALASSLCETLASPIYRTLNLGGLVCPPGFEAELGFEPGCVHELVAQGRGGGGRTGLHSWFCHLLSV